MIKTKMLTVVASLGEAKDSLKAIGEFLSGLSFYLSHPLDLLIKAIEIITPFVYFGALVACAAAILMAIFGNRDKLKWIPTSFVCYLLLRVLRAVLLGV